MKFATSIQIASLVCATSAPAFADDYNSTWASNGRAGLTFGAALATGHIGCETSDGGDCGGGVNAAGGLEVHVGGFVGPGVAILGEIWGMAHTENNYTASQVLITGNARFWALPRLWLQGGLGVARSRVTYDNGPLMASAESDLVPAFAIAAGAELLSTRTFALDLQLRGGSGFYEGDVRVYNAALALGVNWY